MNSKKEPKKDLLLRRPNTKFTLSGKQIKVLLVAMAAFVIAIILVYTQILVNELRQREIESVQFYAEALEYYIQSPTTEDQFYISRIVPAIKFPMILTSSDDDIYEPYSANCLNIPLDTLLPREEQHAILLSYFQEMRSTGYEPVLVRDADGNIISKIYYTNSALLTKLRILPFIEILIIAIFIFMGYVAFNYLKKTEQGYVWVGMAKEAAHQLGTPLSSMLAWIEIAKLNADDPRQVEEIMDEMQHDVERLNKIAQRFSKIGSIPEMQAQDLGLLVDKVVTYFQHRLPHLGKRIEITKLINEGVIHNVNADLFEWVIENLLKNAAESVESGKGVLYVSMEQTPKKTIIYVRDNGKGMPPHIRREVFKPGFSTKKRGWGLGLSLCKRIVEEYHNGKIFVKESVPGKGTTFAVELPVEDLA